MTNLKSNLPPDRNKKESVNFKLQRSAPLMNTMFRNKICAIEQDILMKKCLNLSWDKTEMKTNLFYLHHEDKLTGFEAAYSIVAASPLQTTPSIFQQITNRFNLTVSLKFMLICLRVFILYWIGNIVNHILNQTITDFLDPESKASIQTLAIQIVKNIKIV